MVNLKDEHQDQSIAMTKRLKSENLVLGLCYYLEILFLAFLFFKFVTTAKTALFTGLRKIPGPWYAPWTNFVLKLQVIKGARLHYVHAMHKKYGPVVRISPDEVSINDLESQKAIHRVGSGFLKSEWYAKLNVGPPGVFVMSDPKQHAARRRLFAQAFSNSTLQSIESTIKERIELAVSKIKRDALAGSADVLKWFTFMATDISGELSFGKSFEMLQQEQKTAYIRDLEIALKVGGITAELEPLVKIARCIPIPSLQDALAIQQRLDRYGHEAIQNLKQYAPSALKIDNLSSACIFTKILDPAKNLGLSDYEIEHEASNLIVAGSDTTAISLTYLVWTLLHPSHSLVRERLEIELTALPADPTNAQLAALPYLSAFLKEGLRMYGAAPGSLPRVVPAEGAVLAGFQFPGRVIVSTQAYSLHRDPEIFQDPERFNPDRWIDATQKMVDAFTPFGAGSRTCLGIHLAMMELQLTIYKFTMECQGARLAATTTDESMEIENYFLIAPRSHKCDIYM